MHWLLTVAMVAVPGMVVGGVVQFVIQRRLARAGQVECAIRWPDEGEPFRRWRQGVASARLGTLWFRSGGSMGARLPHGREADILVLGARLEPGRRPGLRQWWSINPGLRIATVDTPQGRLELAAPAVPLRRLVDGVQPGTAAPY